LLVELGAPILDADRAGHTVLANDPDVRDALLARWGDSILTSSSEVDRAAIAQRVFAADKSGTAELKFLESLLHPRIRTELSQLRDKFAAEGRLAAVLDAPLLLEAGWGPLCDFILFVDAPVELRLERAKSRGWSKSEFERREAAQWPIAKKLSHATNILTNSGSADDLRSALRNFWTENIGPIADKP
jgi:dephospho-CoA kinase